MVTDTEKLAAIDKFVESTHTQVCNLLEEAEEREREGACLDEDEMIDVEKWDAVLNITSQLLNILDKK